MDKINIDSSQAVL